MLVQHTEWLYPLARRQMDKAQGVGKSPEQSAWYPRKWDPSLRIKALDGRAAVVETARLAMEAQTGRPIKIASTRYDTSSSLAFYLPGQPFVYSFMSQLGSRQSQYDIWPGLTLPADAGCDVLLVGALDEGQLARIIRPAFARVDPPEMLPVYYEGIKVRDVAVWRCYGFRGFAASSAPAHF
jgi:hypothetical protein